MLEHELESHPDKTFVYDLLNGVKFGFHTGLSNTKLDTFEANNLKSSLSDPRSVSAMIADELSKGYIIGPFLKSPFTTHRVNPLGLAQHKYSLKKRLIVDLSAPHDDPLNPSLNDLIDKSDFSLSYVKLDDAISIINKLGRGAWLCKYDISDAFKIIPIHPSLWSLYGIKWDSKLYFYTRLPFGSRSSPFIFNTLAEAVVWILQNNYGVPHLLHLLDDFLGIESPTSGGDRTMSLMSLVFNKLGIPISTHKTVGPVQVLEYLGIILDTMKMEARLPPDKLTRITQLLSKFLKKKCCVKRDLLSLLGHLVFASRVVVPGRTFMSRLFHAAKKVSKLHYSVNLNSECRADINMWFYLLTHWNGISMFLYEEPISSIQLHLYTDASGVGFSGIYKNAWFSSTWPSELSNNLDMSIALRELYPIVVAAIIWGHTWSRKRILPHCDNMAVVYIINKGRSPCKTIMKLMRRLVIVSAISNFQFVAVHVPGTINLIADSLSRHQLQKFRKLAPEADLTPCQVPSQVLFD